MLFTLLTSQEKLSLCPKEDYFFELLEDFSYLSKKRLIHVKKHFQSDFASVPRFLWSIFPPFGKYSIASLVHDFLYTIEGSMQISGRKEADDIFLEIMTEDKVPFFTRMLFYAAVRLFGAKHYQKRNYDKRNPIK